MADQDTSLPVRTEAAGDIDINISDAVTPSQKLVVNADGSIDTNFAAGAEIKITDGTETLEVNADGSINAVVTASQLDCDDLTFADDKVDASGSSVALDAPTLAALETTIVASITADVSIDDGGNSITVDATQLDIDDLNATDDAVAAHLFDETGTAYSAANPLAVEMVSDQLGDEICDFNTTAALAKDASTTTHTYTVTAAKTFLAESVWASASGKIKVEVLSNGALIYVGFNSTANPNIDIPIKKICKTAATQIVLITITNLDNQAQDVYSTLTGLEV